MKHKPVRIEILSGEGFSGAGAFPQLILNDDPAQLWRDAQDRLREVALLTDAQFRDQGCYNKTDFRVTFEDGDTYEGRYDLRADGLGDDRMTLLEHIRSGLLYHAGLWEPSWWHEKLSEPQQERMRQDIAAKSGPYVEFLNSYDIGDCMVAGELARENEVNRQVQAFGLEERIRSDVSAARLAELAARPNTSDCFKLARASAVESDTVSDGVASAVEIVAARLGEGLVPDPPQARLDEARQRRDDALRERFGSKAPELMSEYEYRQRRSEVSQVVEDGLGAECFACSTDRTYAVLGPLVRYCGAVDGQFFHCFREPDAHAQVLQAMKEQAAVIAFESDEGVKI